MKRKSLKQIERERYRKEISKNERQRIIVIINNFKYGNLTNVAGYREELIKQINGDLIL